MLRRHRFAVDEWGYELLGGLVEPGESSAATIRQLAKRYAAACTAYLSLLRLPSTRVDQAQPNP
ncbi:hypothetical protein ACQPWY_26375 [Pseudonocardia xinjiangensis]|uniref:hypothetical protein n=1 Tax=Pseudonocardia xinjiangensis TaxID=75289 RepID=UPI003D93BA9B